MFNMTLREISDNARHYLRSVILLFDLNVLLYYLDRHSNLLGNLQTGGKFDKFDGCWMYYYVMHWHVVTTLTLVFLLFLPLLLYSVFREL